MEALNIGVGGQAYSIFSTVTIIMCPYSYCCHWTLHYFVVCRWLVVHLGMILLTVFFFFPLCDVTIAGDYMNSSAAQCAWLVSCHVADSTGPMFSQF